MPTFTPPFRTWLIIHFTACSSSSVSHKGRWRRPKACWRALKAACLSAPLAGPKSSLVTSSDGSRIGPPLLLTIFQGFREGVKLVTTNEFIVLIAARLNYKPHATHMYLKCLKDKSRARCARPLQRSAGCLGARACAAPGLFPPYPLQYSGGGGHGQPCRLTIPTRCSSAPTPQEAAKGTRLPHPAMDMVDNLAG